VLADFAASNRDLACLIETAIGFSMKTHLPALNRSLAISPCKAKSADTATASISLSLANSR